MIADERIVSSRNEVLARGFKICVYMLGATVLYRQFYLSQHPNEYWDVLLVLFGSVIYVNLANVARGATAAQGEDRYGRFLIWRAVRIGMVLVVLNLLLGKVSSVSDLGKLLLFLFAIISPILFLFYYWDRWRTKRSGLSD